MSSQAKLLRWEYEPGVADLTERQQELYQDLAFIVERNLPTSPGAIEDLSDSGKPFSTTNDINALEISSLSPNPQPLSQERDLVHGLLLETNTMKSKLSLADQHLDDLLTTLHTVQEKTDALYGDCENLVQMQQQLTKNADLLHSKIEPLLEYDRLTVQLSAPSMTVTSSSFATLLDRLQVNIAYLAANPSFKEASNFRTRYSQLFSKAASLVRNELNRCFQIAVNDSLTASQSAQKAGEGAILDAFSVVYSTFQQASGTSRMLLKDLDERGTRYQEFYGDLLEESQRLYFSARSRLLNPFIQSSLAGYRRSSKQNICELWRLICSFLVRLCREEFRLYYQYFSQPSAGLSEFLDGVCQIFYDAMRPDIIHLDQVEKISDVCCFLNQEILREHGEEPPAELVPFVSFVRVLLADSRERLMFRVGAFIGQEIVGYKAGKGDLAYPEKLEILRQLLEDMKDESRMKMSSRASVSSISSRAVEERYLFSAESQGFWYPTLRRAVGFLSKLYQSLDSQSFKVVAQEVIFRTLESLTRAADELFKTKGRLHSDLFLISHVLFLREHLTLFQVELSTEEISLDFSRVVGAAKGIMQRKASILSLTSRNALLDFFLSSTPDLRTTTIDSRKEVDSHLRGVCLRLVDYAVAKILGPLPEFLEKADVVLAMQKPSSSVKLSNQAFATPEELKEIIAVVYRNIKSELPIILNQFLLYLISSDTQYVLYKPVKIAIWKNLERMNRIMQEAYSDDDRAIVGLPSLEQWNMLLNIPASDAMKNRSHSAVSHSTKSSTFSSIQQV